MFKSTLSVFFLLAMLVFSACGGGSNPAASPTGSIAPVTPETPPTAPAVVTDTSCLSNGKNCFGMGATINATPNCDVQAITCVKVLSTATAAQTNVPLTFGQPLKAGDLPAGFTLQAKDEKGGSVALQMDAVSSHSDGSVRFGVLSAQLPALGAGELRVINLYKAPVAPAQVTPSYSTAAFDLKLAATIYSPQVSRITFGNRSGTTPGTPYLVGEAITMLLQQDGAAAERFNITVTAAQAGGSFQTLTLIAETFMQQVNASSKVFRAYKIGGGGGYENLWITPITTDGKAFTVRFTYSGMAVQSVINQQDYTAPRNFVADAQPALNAIVASGQTPRLNGAVAREYTVVVPFTEVSTGVKHPQLTARLHTRLYDAGQSVRTDMVLENNWTYEPNPGNITYALTVTQGGQVVYNRPPFTHNHHSRWHKVLWSSPEPAVQVRHFMPYFLASRATWNYDLTLAIPESVLAAESSNLAEADTSPMGPAFITPYFPTTGGRPEIGPLPRWTALFLVTQDQRTRASMLANADAAGGIPIHYRDAPTDQPVSLATHPGLAMVIGTSANADALPGVPNGATIWSPDISHQASFAYIPYLITGDVFYLDEIMLWANWNMGAINPGYRDGAAGLVYPEQVRGQAWALRSIGEAAWALPDSHPMKSYFGSRLQNNLSWFVNKYPRNTVAGAVSPLGMIEKADAIGQTGPWQNDFMALITGQLAEGGDPLALEYFNWLSRFTVGRFLNEENGFCRAQAPGYYIKIRDTAGAFITDWGALFKINWPAISSCLTSGPVDGTPQSASDYAAYARAMLGTATNMGYPGAADAFAYWKSVTLQMDKALLSNPTWAIVPRTN